MDLLCTWHMTPNKDVFEELCEHDGGSMLLGNNRTCKIAGIRSVIFKLYDESIRLLTELWYKRFDHVSERGMVEFAKQNLLCGDKVKKLDFCESCVFGKSCRVKFNKGKQRTHGSLNYIHVDLLGPARNPSHSGIIYFLSIVDDYSRKL